MRTFLRLAVIAALTTSAAGLIYYNYSGFSIDHPVVESVACTATAMLGLMRLAAVVMCFIHTLRAVSEQLEQVCCETSRRSVLEQGLKADAFERLRLQIKAVSCALYLAHAYFATLSIM